MTAKRNSSEMQPDVEPVQLPTMYENAEHKASSTVAEPADTVGGFCVYIGPSIRGVIQSGTIYGQAKSEVVKAQALAIEQYPQIAHLIVPCNTLTDDRIKVKTPGNMLHVYYTQLLAGQKS